MGNILPVDDSLTVRGVVSGYLRTAGYSITEASDGTNALGLTDGYDLVILDLMLSDIDGPEVFRRVRPRGVVAPVIMLTARGSEVDRVLGLEPDANDYLVEPFSPRELVLGVNAVLRRQQPRPERGVITDGDPAFDPAARKATLAGKMLMLMLREFDLFTHLVTHPEEVFSREELARVVWDWDVDGASTVTVYVQWSRRKVEPGPQHPARLVTVWSRGYRWEAQ